MYQKSLLARVSLLLAFSGICLAQELPFSIDVLQNNEVLVRSYGAPPVVQRSSEEVALAVSGNETDECNSFAEKGQADGRAGSTVNVTSEGVSATLSSSSNAVGGRCAGFFGKKTDGRAEATAAITTAVTFNQKFPPTNYLVDLPNLSNDTNSVLKIVDGEGNEVTPVMTETGQGLITGKPGEKFQVIAAIKTSANTRDGCCLEYASPAIATGKVDFAIRKAPIIASEAALHGYVIGGMATEGHLTVGAITLNGMLHCTGTLIGKRTVLTAAHCLEGYESQMGGLKFVLGPSIGEPTYPPIKVTSFDYPKGELKGYKFDRITLGDDIGVVYLESVPPVSPLTTLHTGTPSWATIKGEKRYLTFVGYGYDVVANQKIGVGIKREGSWRISDVESRRVSFFDPGKGTCNGDSGGPAFLPYNNEILQVAITSGGPKDCSRGVETRLDAFMTWLRTRII